VIDVGTDAVAAIFFTAGLTTVIAALLGLAAGAAAVATVAAGFVAATGLAGLTVTIRVVLMTALMPLNVAFAAAVAL
jgi:hypothetical protein